MKRERHIVFAGGGTGGHLIPGLAVAQQLLCQDGTLRITFAGGGKPLERKLVAEAGFDYCPLPCRPLPRGPREAVSFVLENLAGYFAAARFLVEEEVAVVVGLGGYASMAMGRAAASQQRGLVLLEQNAVPGRVTRWLASKADVICLSMPQAAGALPRRVDIRITGNPLRAGFHRAAEGASQILVLGGSGGARSLNENVPKALYKLREHLAGRPILHQTGEADLEPTREVYRKLSLDATVVAFIADMPAALARTTMAVCRAGGTTLAELAACGVPAVLLPYPHARDDHQRRNAEGFVAGGGALLLDERDVPGRLDDALAEKISLMLEPGRRTRMSILLERLARPNAAADVAQIVLAAAAAYPILFRTRETAAA